MRRKSMENITFTGLKTELIKDIFIIHQAQNTSKLKPVSEDAGYSHFRSLRAKLAWCMNLRPDIFCAIALLFQITEKTFAEQKTELIRSTNSIVTHLSNNTKTVLKYPKIDNNLLSLQIYSDASYISNNDKLSQL